MDREEQLVAWESVRVELQLLLENPVESKWKDQFQNVKRQSEASNPWFTEQQQITAIKGIIELLEPELLKKWSKQYPTITGNPKSIGVIMAGNIPLAGFHDFLCVLLSGHHIIIKLSSSDKYLLPFIIEILLSKNLHLKNSIQFSEQLNKIDAIIATGSNNTWRYFEYYFGKKPHIFRKNRNSAAIINGDENEFDMMLLGRDIFTYFGLGCRSISKLFVPEGYVFDNFFANIVAYDHVMQHSKYMNNFDYHQSLYLLNRQLFLTNNFLIVTESDAMSSPVGVLYYETYSKESLLQEKLVEMNDDIQCITSKNGPISLGQSQLPKINDFADGVDTMEFLLNV